MVCHTLSVVGVRLVFRQRVLVEICTCDGETFMIVSRVFNVHLKSPECVRRTVYSCLSNQQVQSATRRSEVTFD